MNPKNNLKSYSTTSHILIVFCLSSFSKEIIDSLTPELKEKLIHGIESQNHDISELKTKRDNNLIEILKIKKENKL